MVLLIFCAALLVCLLLKRSILYALVFGLLLFLLHGRRRGFPWRELLRAALDGVRTVRNILLTFVVIGVMTA
ncbi:MAG: sodium:proton antiporter, partial [Oscillospiraceae bacterium]|nr:sodium:proton antiporter [Oscillospiraceae bacterium]